MSNKKSLKSIIYKQLNLPKTICNHVIGKEHNPNHRLTVGAVVMIIGVCVAKIPVGYTVGHILFETIGFLFHCVGAIPMVQMAEKVADVVNKTQDIPETNPDEEI